MNELNAKIAALEAQHTRLKLALFLTAGLVAAAAFVTGVGAQQAASPLRVRGLIIEDEAGRPRIVLGAPLGDGSSGRTGLRINDPSGVERLGMTLLSNGNLVLGLDAPVGQGDDRNRERITLVADAQGGASITFKDRRTSVAARQYLDEQNRVWLEFSDYLQEPTIRRRVGLKGEETINEAR